MLGRELAACAGGHADHQRHAELIARHVAYRGRGVENLVKREQAEVHRHQLDDRAHAGHCRADAGAGESGFRQRRIADALGAELRQQSLAHGVAAAIAADILAHQENALITAQRIADRLAHGIAIAQLDRCGRRGRCHDAPWLGCLVRVGEAAEIFDRLSKFRPRRKRQPR